MLSPFRLLGATFAVAALLLTGTAAVPSEAEAAVGTAVEASTGTTPYEIGVTFNGDATTSRALTWHTAADAGSDVRYLAAATEPESLAAATTMTGTSETGPVSTGGIVHRAVLSDLTGGTTYWYQVGDAATDTWSDISSFETTDDDGQVSFLYVADSQGSTESDYQVAAATFRAGLAQDTSTEFIVQGGDLVDTSESADQWSWLFDSDSDLWSSNTIAAVSGNHDVAADTFAAHFTNDVPEGADQTTGTYYSYDVEGVHFVALNTNDIENNQLGAAQTQWLEDDLSAAKAEGASWIVVVMHKGIQTVAKHMTDADVTGLRAQLTPLLDEYDVDLVLSGHDHTYSRSETLVDGEPDEDAFALSIDGVATDVNPDGVTHLVPNASGTKFYEPVSSDTFAASSVYPEVYGQPDLQMFSNITITDGELVMRSYTVDAAADGVPQLYDTYRIVKDEDADRAALVDEAIDSIGGTVTLDDADAVAEVRAAVDQLDAAELARVTGLADLEAAEAALAELDAVALEGEGTEADPYLIADEDDLTTFVDAVDADLDGARTASYLVTDDILLTGEVTMVDSFDGVLDGGGHTLAGLRLTTDLSGADQTLALIGELGTSGVVRSLGLSGVSITGDSSTQSSTTGTRRASFVALNRGLVEEVYATGTISGAWRSGGIVADNEGTVRNAWFEGSVEGSWETGGIVGRNGNAATSVVEDSWASATVRTLNNNAGVLSGYAYRSSTTLRALVAVGGSVTGTSNLGRVNGQENGGTPAYTDLLAAESITINGATTTGTSSTKQGASTSAAALAEQSTYEGIGWDFDSVWSWGEDDVPVLTEVPERTAADLGLGSDSVETTVSSPDGRLQVRLYTDETASLRYEVTQDGETVVEPSDLGLTIDGVDWSTLVTLGAGETYQGSDDYELLGTQSSVSNTHNGAIVPVSRNGESVMSLDVRVLDAGFAFRYTLADSTAGQTVSQEWTTVDLDQTSTIDYQTVTDSTIDDLQGVSSRATFEELGTEQITVLPTVELTGGGYLNLAESNVRDWPALALQTSGTGEISTYYWATDSGDGTFEVSADTLHSPWRVVTIADDLDTLSSSALVTSLADPLDEELFADADEWVVPGTSLWVANNGAGLKSVPSTFYDYIDGAAELGLEYVLIEDMSDASWGSTTAETFAIIADLVDYGAERGVGIWVWTDYDNGNGIEDDFLDTIDDQSGFGDRDSLQNEDYRDAYLDLLVETGVAGVKIDHINEETETKVNLYADVDEAAAERQLLIAWHNPMAPTGLERTYPNELVREAIRGFQSGYDATQNTILPFTRLIAGTADYTPLSFTNTSLAGNATWAHQMASTVVYSAPYLQISEIPSTMVSGGIYETQLGDFVSALPSVWESSEVLDLSDIGSVAAVVRTTSDGEYWVAVQAATDAAQQVEIPLSFLPEGVAYTADAYRDGSTATQVDRTVSTVDSTDTLTADLRSGGGFVVRITLDEVEQPNDEGVYELDSEEDLELLREHPSASFRLTADIEMTEPFTPIASFSGTLDGDGYEIRGLEIAAAEDSGSRAFILTSTGTITQLGLEDVRSERPGDYTSGEVVAALVATNKGVISETYVTDAVVSGGWRAAILVAENSGTISDSYVTGTVHGNWETAGLSAWNSATATVERSYADAEVTADVQNSGLVTAYAYSGTVLDGLVALGGSVDMTGSSPIGRISARENGAPTYSGGLALASITLNGVTVSGSQTDKNGQSVSQDDLLDEATYQAVGWDFDSVWEMSDELGRPVLRDNDEQESVTIEFDTAGGQEIDPVQITGDVLPDLPTPERDGYDFTGWTAQTATGPVPVQSGASVAGLGDPIVLQAGWQLRADAIARIELATVGGVSSVDQGGTVQFTVTGYDDEGNALDGTGGLVVLTSDMATDVVDGLSVSFPHASPHVITATVLGSSSVTSSVAIEVIPAETSGSDDEGSGSDDETSGSASGPLPTSSASVSAAEETAAEAAGQTGSGSQVLAVTGLEIGGAALAALAVLAAGAALVLARRRAARRP
ncbi:MAG TPA: glycoside hydrolase family 97 catalytic domain-containing protein [Cellulomonas sp.]